MIDKSTNTQVTSKKDQQQYWMDREKPYRFISGREFAEAFQSSVVGRRIGEELSVPYDRSKNHPAALTTEKYGLGRKELLKACTEREFLLMKRNSFVYFFKLFQASICKLGYSIFHGLYQIKYLTDTDIVCLKNYFSSLSWPLLLWQCSSELECLKRISLMEVYTPGLCFTQSL